VVQAPRLIVFGLEVRCLAAAVLLITVLWFVGVGVLRGRRR